ncbi:hypothetical protein D9756_004468 [Leucocoprinus leucothites]|uniref:Uncharacterized protein n=1 Tax=Leucocoprinus leucothites TaxID=201217 RepID=A0A8H5GA12_9AGAR|nr:hypothetical protein D9756_004468 [Leucoagaricus leucothites]
MYTTQPYDSTIAPDSRPRSASELDAARILSDMRSLMLGSIPRSTHSPSISTSNDAISSSCPSSNNSDPATSPQLLPLSPSDSTSCSSSASQCDDDDLSFHEESRRVTRLRTKSITSHPRGGIGKVRCTKVTRIRKSRKNKTEHERIEEFSREQFVGKILPHAVWCSDCEDWVGLDKRRAYYFGMWEKHMKYYHLPGGKGYELMDKHFAQTGKRLKLFKPKRSGNWWLYD